MTDAKEKRIDWKVYDLDLSPNEDWIVERLERISAILRNAGLISTEAASEISGIDLQDFVERYGMRLSE